MGCRDRCLQFNASKTELCIVFPIPAPLAYLVELTYHLHHPSCSGPNHGITLDSFLQIFLSSKIFPNHCTPLHHCYLLPWSRPLPPLTWTAVVAYVWFLDFRHFTRPVIAPCHSQGGSGSYLLQWNWRGCCHIWKYGGQDSKDGPQDSCLTVSSSNCRWCCEGVLQI